MRIHCTLSVLKATTTLNKSFEKLNIPVTSKTYHMGLDGIVCHLSLASVGFNRVVEISNP